MSLYPIYVQNAVYCSNINSLEDCLKELIDYDAMCDYARVNALIRIIHYFDIHLGPTGASRFRYMYDCPLLPELEFIAFNTLGFGRD